MLVKSLEQISLCHCCIYILAFIRAVPTNHNSCVQDVENRVYLNSCCQFQRSFVKLGKRTRRILLQKGVKEARSKRIGTNIQRGYTKYVPLEAHAVPQCCTPSVTPRVLSLSEVHRLKRLEPHGTSHLKRANTAARLPKCQKLLCSIRCSAELPQAEDI
ncbi:unnamed protein product [Cladocopium goreaui]|uniref:Uncharacterized protein n=1 Tax=Cladocopium goreaui TaxID=2562237 RepID=A0A9P1FUT0_9DINO|nr:unnamed protein product [Cladocopium goreaui]